jgi:hypothetical protein
VISCAKLNTATDGSNLQPRKSPVQVGEMAPDFSLDSQNGQKVTLSEARATAPTVLVFYRGNW